MGIQKCENWGTEFKYRALLKPFVGYPNILDCSNCGASHKMTGMSRFIISALMILPIFIQIGIRSFKLNILLVLLIYLVYIVITKALSPYILRYKLKDVN